MGLVPACSSAPNIVRRGGKVEAPKASWYMAGVMLQRLTGRVKNYRTPDRRGRAGGGVVCARDRAARICRRAAALRVRLRFDLVVPGLATWLPRVLYGG